jgi:alpha-ketoglutarate-dependent taurine dioxygenase
MRPARSRRRIGASGSKPFRAGRRQAILPFLLAHASSPNYTVGFSWKPGDFVIWDNQSTWHFAVNDYQGPRAYRKVIGG